MGTSTNYNLNLKYGFFYYIAPSRGTCRDSLLWNELVLFSKPLPRRVHNKKAKWKYAYYTTSFINKVSKLSQTVTILFIFTSTIKQAIFWVTSTVITPKYECVVPLSHEDTKDNMLGVINWKKTLGPATYKCFIEAIRFQSNEVLFLIQTLQN